MSKLITETASKIRISAIGVEMDKHLRIINKTALKSHIALGDAGIGKELKKEGYICTICADFGVNPMIGFAGTQDLHVTKEQLEALKEAIEHFLDRDVVIND